MLVDLDFTIFASLLRWKKLKGKNNLLEISTLQLKMKLHNSRVSFYLFVSYLYKINKNHAMLWIKIRRLIFVSEGPAATSDVPVRPSESIRVSKSGIYYLMVHLMISIK